MRREPPPTSEIVRDVCAERTNRGQFGAGVAVAGYGSGGGEASPTGGHAVTERKPTGVSWESWTERQIEQGRRAGLFEGLDGAGQPIEGLDGPHDEEWWVKAKLRREEIAYLPPTIAVRAEREAAIAAAVAAADEGDARRILAEINDRIRYLNSHAVAGPPSTVWIVDVEAVLERRRLEHSDEPGDGVSDAVPVDVTADAPPPAVRRSRFRRPFRRRS